MRQRRQSENEGMRNGVPVAARMDNAQEEPWRKSGQIKSNFLK